jgi:hypothetical protein
MLSKRATGIADSGRQVLPTRLLLWTLLVVGLVFPGVLRASCGSPGNAIEAENCLTGTPQSTWDISGAGDATIQGFADQISVNQGGTINFKVSTNASSYHLDIYRMGYYQGNGARLVTTVTPSATLPQTQPACLTDATTGLYDCGNWAVSASWAVPSTAVSGIYFARVVRDDTQGASHIVFIVRNDASHSNILFQTSDLTWQAYNDQGGQNLYGCNGAFDLTCRAFKVSYNRPFHTRVFEPESWVFNAEYPMVRWLEANGYDVTYTSGVDTDSNGALLLNHKVWMSNGHDEYVSGNQRANIQTARDAGADLAFFSGNTMFWKTRWENSIDGTNTSYRTLVCYKETHANAVIDPSDPPTWTGTWRDPRFSPPADGGRPENALVGTLFRMNGGQNVTLLVPAADGKMRFWRNTAVASLPSGQTATLAPGAIGAEFDDDEDNGFRPAGLFELSATSVTDPSNVLLDYGTTYGAGTVVHKITMYKAPSGALVFATGTYQWSWGLDANHDRSNLGSTTDPSMQQATVNLFADMGVQPVSLQAPLAPASASSDTTPPTSTITSPASGANLQPGAPVTVQGTAVDAGGGVVAGVEVSMDGGATWHPAVGRASWSYSGNTASSGSVTIRSRAVDDSGNLETPSAGVSVNVAEQSCPCTIWPSSAAPANGDPGPDSSVELGVRFQADFDGTITGIRFYKFAANTGTHVGNLWSSGGGLLGSATFTNESGSGWQEVDFTSPVAVTANTVYIASYHTDVGHYALDSQYFASAGFDNPPLHALQNTVSGGNGLFGYGTGNVFPSSTFNSANYWVDLVYSSTSTVMLNSITVAPSQATIQVGGTQQFTATGHYSDSSTQDITSQVTWSSSNTASATINSSGLATALSGDGPTITASKGSVSGSALLSVHGTPLVITTTALPAGGQSAPYSFQIAASGGVLPYTWTLLSGTLPAGLSLASNGQIAGTPTTLQTTNFTVQVTDSGTKDALNPQQIATQALSITVYPPPLIVSIFPPTAVPTRADVGGDNSLELGVKFRADANGSISAIRYYKSVDNIGTHTGHLWTIGGTLLGSVTFTGETASGWQQANFSSPIPITAGTVYLASYHADYGGYSDDLNYFVSSGVDNPPLHALRDGISAGNGVFDYGTGTVFPNSSTKGSNYWVDVVFVQTVPDTTPPTVISISPSNGASGVDPKGAINVVFSKALDPTSLNSNTVILQDPTNAAVPATVSYNSDTDTVTLTPTSALQNSATYTVVLEGGSTDPRIKDLPGNALAVNFVSSFNTAAPPPPSPTAGPGGPILVVSAAANPLSLYYAEILRAEGLNEFAVLDISQVQSSTLAGYDVVVLGDTPLTSDQVTMFTNWVNGGGNLIAMHPDPQLAGLLGLVDTGSALSNAYVLMNTTAGPGVGLVGQTIQFHGPAELYTLNGAISFADLYSNASTPSGNPAVTANPVGTGIATAFTYDLARSVVYTRQGNPAWNAQARDGLTPMRSDDLFFGNAGFDPEPDWVDFNKIQIPQADEQQRLLANLILQMNSIKRPLPRFWYFPRGLQAVVVLTGDDHGTFYPTGGASAARFDQLMEASPVGCSVETWQCLRSTAYLFPPSIASNPLSNAQAADFISAGFEVSVHVDTSPDCSNYTSLSALDADYAAQLSSFASGYPSAPASQTHRMHCVAWSDYDSQPQVEFNHGIRLDTTYYYYPQSWITDRPGLFTGSGMPMRFTTLNGTMVDVYQATSQMTDESGQTYPLHIDTLLDNALNLGYYGAFVANMHNDTADPTAASSIGTAAILASAQSRGVPIISAVQLLKWLDGRNGSSFSLQSWDGATLAFNILVGSNAQGLQAMLPATFSGTPLNSLTLNGSPVSHTLQTVKGMQYAVFAATSNGAYSAQYNAVTSVTVNPTLIVGGDPSTGTVTINSPALSGGVVVTLQSDNPAARIPGNVTIAQGQTSASFNISTSQVLSTTPVHITGSFNSTSQPATLTLTPQLAPTTAVTVTAGGNPSPYGSSVTFMATVSGAGPAPTGSVSFYDGGTCSIPGAALGSAVVLNGSAQASVTTSTLTAAASPHTILACYSGDVNYATSAGTLAQTVNPATVIPSITASSKVYDGTATATLATRSLSGVIGADNVTLSGGTATFADRNAGNAKTVTVTGLTLSGTTAANYQLSSTTATATANITVAAVTVTADTQSKVYGNIDPALTYKLTSGSLGAGDSFAGGLTRVAGATVGTYAIQQGTLALTSNYTLSYVGANLTITAAPLTVTAANVSRSYGVANPAFTGTLTGVQNNDNITATYSSSATINSPAGPYAIVPALVDPGSKLGNYSVTANNGVLTVTALTVTAVSLNPAAVAGGAGTTGTVTLSGIAPTGGAVVALQSGTPSLATVPTNVTVLAGQNSATFAVTTTVATTAANVTITATLAGSVQTTLTVNLSLLARNGWSLLSVDSQETSCYNGAGTNAFDGNPSTLWHTQFCGSAPPTPHQISINLGASYRLSGFQYLPRQDGSACGWIKQYAFYVSTDGVNWGTAVATGTFSYGNLSTNCPGPGAGVPAAIEVTFSRKTAQYIRLVANSELHGNPWTSMAELNVLGTASGNNPAPSLAQVTVNPGFVVGGASSQGTVTLTEPAPAGGSVVSLASSNPAATVPASVTVPANAFSANFTITTTAVGAVTPLNISGSLSSNAQTSFTVNPGGLISQTGWSLVSVDSQETSCYNGVATNAFDGNSSTLWHTQFCGSAPPTPHQISINLGASYNLTAFQYLPRQDGSACGWIKDYAFYVSSDGVNWGTAVATGTFNYGNLSTTCPGPGAGVPSALQIAFPQTTGQYIQLVALDELQGHPWTSVAELNVLGTASANNPPPSLAQVTVNPAIVVGGASAQGTVTLSGPAPAGGAVVSLASSDPSATVPLTVTVPANAFSATFTITTTAVGAVTQPNISGSYSGNAQTSFTVNPGSLISQTSWSVVSVDSQETSCYNGVATNAFDGNSSTLWHTQFCSSAPPTPHQISINLGASYNLTAFQYLPRQDGSACGWIKDYAFYVSSDGVNWGTAVATGTFNYGNLSTTCPGPGAGVPAALQIAFPQTTGQYIRLVALDELNGHPWTSVAELNVLGTTSASNPPPSLAQVTVNPAFVVGGASTQGTVTLSGPAPVGGVLVSLASSDPSATVPLTVTVPANAFSATFTITTTAVGAVTQPNISGSLNGNAQTSFTVNPGSLIPQAVWSVVSVDSQETTCYNGAATNAFDGNSGTLWHTQFCNTNPPTPHQISINLGASYSLTAFQYLPRQDGSACGWIKDYAFYVSSDGVNWGTAVATGTFNYGNLSTNCPGPGAGVPAALQVAFPQTTGQYIQLVALDELQGHPWTSVAELNVLGTASASNPPPSVVQVTVNPAIVVGGTSAQGTVTLSGPAPAAGAVVSLASSDPSTTVPLTVTVPANAFSANFTITTVAVGAVAQLNISGSYNGSAAQASFTVNSGTLISQAGWSLLYVDSQETTCYNGAATNAFDGNPATAWSTQFCGTVPPGPHEIQINLGASHTLTAFRYLAQQDGSSCGWIQQYEFYVSSDGLNWGSPVATGSFDYTGLTQACFGPGASLPPARQVAFPAVTAQYIRFREITGFEGTPVAAAAELNVLGQ